MNFTCAHTDIRRSFIVASGGGGVDNCVVQLVLLKIFFNNIEGIGGSHWVNMVK